MYIFYAYLAYRAPYGAPLGAPPRPPPRPAPARWRGQGGALRAAHMWPHMLNMHKDIKFYNILFDFT